MIKLTDDIMCGKSAADLSDLQTAHKPCMYAHSELIIKCVHENAFLHRHEDARAHRHGSSLHP